MRAHRWSVGLVLCVGLGACGGGSGGGPSDTGATAPIEAVISPATSPLASLRGVTCSRVGGTTELVASGTVSSRGDDTLYVSVQVRFVDAEGVRVALATDSVTDLLVGEDARWDASTYEDGVADVRRCEVTVTVS